MGLDITVIILTFNEAQHIARAIDSVRGFAKYIYIVDSGSTDETLKISQLKGAIIFDHEFINQAKQFQWAIDYTPISTEWVMRLDADEVIESDLASELVNKIPTLANDVVGINIDRKHIFMGKWVRYGGRYPLKMLRIWRRGKAQVEDRWMDEHIVISGGRAISLKGGFSDNNLNNLTFFTDKHNKYATREAVEVIVGKLNLSPDMTGLNSTNSSFRASFKRTMKESIYNRLPFGVGSLLYIFYRYIILLGFLDGKSGFIYHVLQGYWYRLLVEAKVYEFERAIGKHHSPEEKLKELSRLTGYRL